jgi:hypothetical protein
MIDYSTSKFQDALTESAYAVAGDGFADDTSGDLSDGVDWSALVVVDGKHVIIREDAQGFVWTDYAEDWHGAGRCSVQRSWDRIAAEDAVRLTDTDY